MGCLKTVIKRRSIQPVDSRKVLSERVAKRLKESSKQEENKADDLMRSKESESETTDILLDKPNRICRSES